MSTRTKKHTLDLASGPVTSKLLAFTMPILASNLLQHLYNAADRAVVGKFAVDGDMALAAVGSTGSAITLLLNLFTGLALGANVVCSNMRGAANTKDLRKAMHTSILLAGLCGVFMMIFGIAVTKPFLLLMGCPENVLEASTLYMRIHFLGTPFQLLYNFGAAILNSHGDTKRPMTILSLSGLLNVALNLVFVLFCGMSVDGVALATVAAQALSAIVVLWILFKPDGGYDLNISELKIRKNELANIVRIGVPCGLNGMVFSVANVIIQSSVNSLGDVAMAGNSAAAGYTGLVYQILAAFYSGCISFSGQCYGAKKYKRIDKLVGRSILLCSGMIAVLATVATIFPYFFLGIFTNNKAAMDSGIGPMVIICWSYMLYGVSEVFLGTLRGMRRSGMPTLINAIFICIPRLLWVFIAFPLYRTVWFLYLCYPISYVFSSTMQGIYFWRTRRKLDAQHDEVEE